LRARSMPRAFPGIPEPRTAPPPLLCPLCRAGPNPPRPCCPGRWARAPVARPPPPPGNFVLSSGKNSGGTGSVPCDIGFKLPRNRLVVFGKPRPPRPATNQTNAVFPARRRQNAPENRSAKTARGPAAGSDFGKPLESPGRPIYFRRALKKPASPPRLASNAKPRPPALHPLPRQASNLRRPRPVQSLVRPFAESGRTAKKKKSPPTDRRWKHGPRVAALVVLAVPPAPPRERMSPKAPFLGIGSSTRSLPTRRSGVVLIAPRK